MMLSLGQDLEGTKAPPYNWKGFCVFPQDQSRLIWITGRNVRQHPTDQDGPPLADRSRTEEAEEAEPPTDQDLLKGH